MALRQLAEATTAGSRIACRLDCSGPDLVFDSRVSVHLYRTAQEAVSNAVRHSGGKNIYLCEETTQQLLGGVVGGTQRSKASGVESLSDRELEVFRLIGQGLSTSQIANRLNRSTHTVETHRQKIKTKLNLNSAGELNLAAVQWMLENG